MAAPYYYIYYLSGKREAFIPENYTITIEK